MCPPLSQYWYYKLFVQFPPQACRIPLRFLLAPWNSSSPDIDRIIKQA